VVLVLIEQFPRAAVVDRGRRPVPGGQVWGDEIERSAFNDEIEAMAARAEWQLLCAESRYV
jgi:hypothetical protein